MCTARLLHVRDVAGDRLVYVDTRDLVEFAYHTTLWDGVLATVEDRETLYAIATESQHVQGDTVSQCTKGGGANIVLHGPPGTGKTYTAEALCEAMERPLFYVSSARLSVDPEVLSHALREIMDVAMLHNGVVVIDEVDVYIECRSTESLSRNALVCQMCMLLEYHNCVVFMTTNRYDNVDPAIASRVVYSARYRPLSPTQKMDVAVRLAANIGVEAGDPGTIEGLADAREILAHLRIKKCRANHKRKLEAQGSN